MMELALHFGGCDYIGDLCDIDKNEQYCHATPSNTLETIALLETSVEYWFPDNNTNSKNYFTGLTNN